MAGLKGEIRVPQVADLIRRARYVSLVTSKGEEPWDMSDGYVRAEVDESTWSFGDLEMSWVYNLKAVIFGVPIREWGIVSAFRLLDENGRVLNRECDCDYGTLSRHTFIYPVKDLSNWWLAQRKPAVREQLAPCFRANDLKVLTREHP